MNAPTIEQNRHVDSHLVWHGYLFLGGFQTNIRNTLGGYELPKWMLGGPSLSARADALFFVGWVYMWWPFNIGSAGRQKKQV